MQRTDTQNNAAHSTFTNSTDGSASPNGSATVRVSPRRRFLGGLKTRISDLLGTLSGHKRKADEEVLTTTPPIPAIPVPEIDSHSGEGDTPVIPVAVPIATDSVLETAAFPAGVPIDVIGALDTFDATDSEIAASEAITALMTHSPMSERENLRSSPLSPETTPPSRKNPRPDLMTSDSENRRKTFEVNEALEESTRKAYDKLALHLARYGFSENYMEELNARLINDTHISKKRYAEYYTKFDQSLTNIVAANINITKKIIEQCALQIIANPHPKIAIDKLEVIGEHYAVLRTTLQLSDEQIFNFVRTSKQLTTQVKDFVAESDFLIEKKFTTQDICHLIDRLTPSKVQLFFKYGKILVGPQSVFKNSNLFAELVIKVKNSSHLERHLALLASDTLQTQLKSQPEEFFNNLLTKADQRPSRFKDYLLDKLSTRNLRFHLESLTPSPHTQPPAACSSYSLDLFPSGIANDDSISDHTKTDTDSAAGADVANMENVEVVASMDDAVDANMTDVANMDNIEDIPEKNAATAAVVSLAAAPVTFLTATASLAIGPTILVNSDQTLQPSSDMQTILSDASPQSQVVNTSSLFRKAVSSTISGGKTPSTTPREKASAARDTPAGNTIHLIDL